MQLEDAILYEPVTLLCDVWQTDVIASDLRDLAHAITTTHCKVLVDEILADCSQNRQSAKINSPPKFPAIRYMARIGKERHFDLRIKAQILLRNTRAMDTAY